jgi:hypothetical protein
MTLIRATLSAIVFMALSAAAWGGETETAARRNTAPAFHVGPQGQGVTIGAETGSRTYSTARSDNDSRRVHGLSSLQIRRLIKNKAR